MRAGSRETLDLSGTTNRVTSTNVSSEELQNLRPCASAAEGDLHFVPDREATEKGTDNVSPAAIALGLASARNLTVGAKEADSDSIEEQDFALCYTKADGLTYKATGRFKVRKFRHKLFVTSTTQAGNLSGLTGADQTCQTLAAAAGLTSSRVVYKAVLSSLAYDAIRRIRILGPVYDTQGNRIARAGSFFSATHETGIRYNENGTEVPNESYVFTAMHPPKGMNPGTCTCNEWTFTGPAGSNPSWENCAYLSGGWQMGGWVGVTHATNYRWAMSLVGMTTSQMCSTASRLYCISQPVLSTA